MQLPEIRLRIAREQRVYCQQLMKHLAGDDTARSGRKQNLRRYQRRPATVFASVLDSLRGQ